MFIKTTYCNVIENISNICVRIRSGSIFRLWNSSLSFILLLLASSRHLHLLLFTTSRFSFKCTWMRQQDVLGWENRTQHFAIFCNNILQQYFWIALCSIRLNLQVNVNAKNTKMKKTTEKMLKWNQYIRKLYVNIIRGNSFTKLLNIWMLKRFYLTYNNTKYIW